jgi:SAM-dependent methyltransferase
MSRLESDYYTFMKFDPERSRAGLAHYVGYFPTGPVLELACGRGEFLGLLAQAGIDAYGVDIDDGMVQIARERGVRADAGDALEYLAAQPDESLRGLFCAHFLEHLDAEHVEAVYAQAARVLADGGVFVAAVPNAACLSVMGYDFWRDPTHVRFYDPVLLGFFAERAGLHVVESGGNPNNDSGPPTETFPIEMTPVPSLAERLAYVADRIARVRRANVVTRVRRSRARPHFDESRTRDLDGTGALLAELTTLATTLDDHVQTTQHYLFELRAAYSRLLRQLYPANEVYVVARKGSATAAIDTEPSAPGHVGG